MPGNRANAGAVENWSAHFLQKGSGECRTPFFALLIMRAEFSLQRDDVTVTVFEIPTCPVES